MMYGNIICMVGWMILSAAAGADGTLRIYLPQEVQLNDEQVTLGCVGILLGDAALTEQAAAISLGSFSTDGQTLRADRRTILSRLASEGIDAGQVQIHGAETVQIRRHEMTVSAERIIDSARRHLDKTLGGGAVISVSRRPQDQVLSTAGGAAELMVAGHSRQGGGVMRVRVAILQDGEEVAGEDVFFTVSYEVRRVMAGEDLPPGTELTSENIRVQTVQSDQPEPADWRVPYGMVTRRRIAEGTLVADALLEPKQSPVMIRRRDNVEVRFDNGVLFVSTHGEAMDEGRVGDTIRVRRGQRPDQRIIMGRVQADGTVKPVL